MSEARATQQKEKKTDAQAGDLKIHPIANLFPMLPPEELQALADDIRANGLQQPLTKQGDTLLDGRNRMEACQMAEVDPKFNEYEGTNPAAFIIGANLKRRNLKTSQKVAIALELRPYFAEEAKKRQLSTLKKGARTDVENIPQRNQARSRDQAAAAVGVSGRMVDILEEVKEKAPGLYEKVKAGEMTVNSAKNQMKRIDHKKKGAKGSKAALEAIKKAGLKDIQNSDFREFGKSIPDDSVALIFTDPPYDRETLPLFGEMAEMAARVLVDGGSLITYCGQYQLPELFNLMCPHVKFLWPICVSYHTPQNEWARMIQLGIRVGWKPLLWFVKGTNRRDIQTFVPDRVESMLPEKNAHKWQQPVAEARTLIELLTTESEIVFDPFCGGGTTAVAAKLCGRKYLTCDVDPVAVATAIERIGK